MCGFIQIKRPSNFMLTRSMILWFQNKHTTMNSDLDGKPIISRQKQKGFGITLFLSVIKSQL